MKKLKEYKDLFLNFIKYNKQFSTYVVLSLLCSTTIRFFTIGGFFELQPFFIDLGIILVLGSFCFFYKPQKQFWYLFVLMLLYTIIAIVNAMYFSFFNSFASISLLTALGQAKDVDEAVVAGIHLYQFIYIIFPIWFYAVHRKLYNRDYFNFVAKFEKSRSLLKKVLISGIIVLGICAATLSATAYGRLVKQWNREYIVDKFGIVLYQINDIVNSLRPTIITWFGYDIALKKFYDYFEQSPVQKSNNEYTNIYEGKNIIFVHMESMSSFLVDLEINDKEITPNLNKLTKEGMYFSNFYPQIGVGTSSDTEFTITTSLMPSTSGTAFVSYYDRTYISIPKLFSEKDYYTFSMHGNKASMWNRSLAHPKLGYKDFYSRTSFDPSEKIGLGISDKSFFNQGISILKEIEDNNQKYMGTIITLSNHTPFENNELFNQLDLTYKNGTHSYLEETKLGEYLVSSHYADEALGDFIKMIKESDYFDNTIFVFYGDHDPRLATKEYNKYYNFNPETGELYDKEDENYYNYDFYANELNRKTPLIIWEKNKEINQKVDYFMGSIDVLPTIGNMFGFYSKYALGHDIFEIRNDNIIPFTNGNFLTNKVYYNSTKEEYRAISLDETLSEEYINYCHVYSDNLIDVSNGIIIHDIIKKIMEENK